MFAAESPDEFFDKYIDPGVYGLPQSLTPLALDSGSAALSTTATPHRLSHVPHTGACDASHGVSTSLSRFSVDPGMHTFDNSRHSGAHAGGDYGLGACAQSSVEERHCEKDRHCLKTDEADWSLWFKDNSCTNLSDPSGMLQLPLAWSSTMSAPSEVTSPPFKMAPMPDREEHGSLTRSQKSGWPHMSSPSSSMSEYTLRGLTLCHVCSMSFSLPKDLRRHIKSIHDQERWACPEQGCVQEFSRRDKLLRHRRSCHKPHVNATERCSGLLGSPGGEVAPILDEVRGEMPGDQGLPTVLPPSVDSDAGFNCQFCHQKFKYQHDRLRHLRTVHRKRESAVYRCPMPACPKHDKLFNRVDNFRKHLKVSHDLKDLEETISQSKAYSGATFTIITPDIYSSSI